MDKLKLPLGLEDYRNVKEQCYYVDKTLFIEDILQAPDSSVFLYTRPRRFGKSLMLSMLGYFFDARLDSEKLFHDTAIGSVAEAMAFLNSRPVLHLNLKGVTAESFEGFLSSMSLQVGELYNEALSEESEHELAATDATFSSRAKAGTLNQAELEASLSRLLRYVDETQNKKPLLLIDEYDAPLDSANSNGYYARAQCFMKNFLGNALKGNNHLWKAVLTGVNQISHASIFSGLNNLLVNNILDNKKEYFGFSEDEVLALLKYYDFQGDSSALAHWYGGYRFQNEFLYNPWSVLHYVAKGFVYRPYWTNTGSYSVLKGIILRGDAKLTGDFETLMDGGTVVSPIRESLSFDELGDDASVFSLLLFSGYLTAEPTPDYYRYALRIPNEEVRLSFKAEILGEFSDNRQFQGLLAIKDALARNDDARFEELFRNYLLSAFSYFDLTSEKAYQIIVVTLWAMLFDDAFVRSEVNAGEGRCDILIRDRQNRYCHIIELKYRKNRPTDDSLLSSAYAAIGQIKRNDYIAEAKSYGVPTVHLYGMAFAGKRLKIAHETLTIHE